MNEVRVVKKTRIQKRSRIIGFFALGLSVITLAGVIVTSLCLPKRKELDSFSEGTYVQEIHKGIDRSYYLTTTAKEGETIKDNYIYHYDENNNRLEKHSLFDEAKEKFGVTGLSSINGFYPNYDEDRAYAYSGKYLFGFTGLKNNNLTLTNYTNNFKGEIRNVALKGNDLYVISRDGKLLCIDRFDATDNTYTPKASGYVYALSTYKTGYRLECSQNVSFIDIEIDGDYINLVAPQYIRRLHKDLSGTNYKNLYDTEYAIYQDHDLALAACKAKYGWGDDCTYDADKHTITLAKDKVSKDKFAFYTMPKMYGSLFKDDNIYFVGDNAFYTYTVSELSKPSDPTNSLNNRLVQREDINLAAEPADNGNCFCYDSVGDTAIVRYDEASSKVSVFDLNKKNMTYTINLTTRLYEGFYNENTQDLIYKYQDPVNKETGRNYISSANVPLELTRNTTTGLLIASAILLGISFITTLVCFLSFKSKKVMDSVAKTGKGLKKHWPIYVILFPSVFILCMFCYYPGIAAMVTSLFDYKAGISDVKTWNNFANYAQIFTNLESLRNFGNMAIFLLADVVLAIIPPLIFAFFLSVLRSKKLSKVLRTLLFIPGIIPGIAGLLIWRTCIYGDYGVINSIIKACGGTQIQFFSATDYTNVLWIILMGFPFVGSYLIFYGAMMNVPSSYYEAAEIDGITVWKRFIKIDVPLCLPQLKYVLIMTIIASIQNFSRIYVAMNGTPGVISTPITEMYILMNSSERNYGLASAYATILFVILFGLTFASMRNRVKEK